MSPINAQIKSYLDRINYQGSAEPRIQTLFDLHRGHTMNIPFENLAIFEGSDIHIDPDSLIKKIVQEKRGGYCFEMNGLLAFVLRQLGFEVRDLLGRVFISETDVFAKLHHVLLVDVEGRRFLCDVGFGGNGLIDPIELHLDQPATQLGETYQVVYRKEYGYILQHQLKGTFTNQYAFNLDVCKPVIDYLAPNFFCSKFPQSLFTNQIMCTRPTSDGRITISDRMLKIRKNNETETVEASDTAAFNQLVREHFDLEVDSSIFRNAKGDLFFKA